ncbi:MAG: phosphatidylglycerophosphatase A [candidate division NC10 bacterium]|nr:phosphatidylglycerophosphatase A [candidate division NC10 bacterium]
MKQSLSDRLVVAIATGAYVGYLRPAPGTLGSILGLLLLWPVGAGTLQALVTLCLIGVGIVVAGRAAEIMGAQDPSDIIIDEIAGIAVATMFLPTRFLERAVAFVLFRLFDIIKPFPARQAERLSGGVGIVADDLIAGLYANLLVHVWLFLS